jgi:hypothetical protein
MRLTTMVSIVGQINLSPARVDESTGNTSEPLRNMIMKHADTKVFLNHYLSRRITADTQAIVRGTAPQEEIMKAACRMSRSIDPNRPQCLTPEQSQSINSNPKVRELLRKRDLLKSRNLDKEHLVEINRDVRNEKQRLRHKLLQQLRTEYDRAQAKRDIQLQLEGLKFGETIKANLGKSLDRTPEHIQLIERIMSLPGANLTEENSRRSAAIDAVAAYCHVEEGRTRRSQHGPNPQASQKAETRNSFDPEKELEAAKVAVNQEKRPTVCFICLGNKRLPVKRRISTFQTPGDLSRHFKLTHLSKVGKKQEVTCLLCELRLYGREHLQRHAFEKHGTVS